MLSETDDDWSFLNVVVCLIALCLKYKFSRDSLGQSAWLVCCDSGKIVFCKNSRDTSGMLTAGLKESIHAAFFDLSLPGNCILPVGNFSFELRHLKIGCMSSIDFVPLGRIPLSDTPLGNMQSVRLLG